jgi:hypothetical protein
MQVELQCGGRLPLQPLTLKLPRTGLPRR